MIPGLLDVSSTYSHLYNNKLSEVYRRPQATNTIFQVNRNGLNEWFKINFFGVKCYKSDADLAITELINELNMLANNDYFYNSLGGINRINAHYDEAETDPTCGMLEEDAYMFLSYISVYPEMEKYLHSKFHFKDGSELYKMPKRMYCECGKEKHGFMFHMFFCPKYEKP